MAEYVIILAALGIALLVFVCRDFTNSLLAHYGRLARHLTLPFP